MSAFQSLKTKASYLVGVVGTMALTSPLVHASIDTTEALAELDNAGTAMAAVGGAILGLAGISLAYRWVKATFF